MAVAAAMTGNALAQDVYVNIENKAVSRFLSEVSYTMESASRIKDYSGLLPASEGRKPVAAMVKVPQTEADTLTLVLSEKKDFSNPRHIGISSGEDEVKVTNLIPHAAYHYKIVTLNDDIVSQGHIFTQGQVRMIDVPVGGFNIRDMGGWPTADGRSVKYGRLFRGSELNGTYVADSSSLAMLRELGVGAEIDMRYTGENPGAGISPFGFKTEQEVASGELPTFYFMNNLNIQTYNFNYDSFTSRVRTAFRFINEHLKNGNAVYMHCIWGIDRTGLFAMMLEGLLGVEYDGLMKDYELSCFAGSGKTKSNRDDVINFFEKLEGNTLQEKINRYFIDRVKVTQEEIDFFRSEMLEDAPVSVSYSGTLPVMFISVNDSIKSKEEYVAATFFIDPMGGNNAWAVGSADEPISIDIRGRGNWTWFGPYEKKPYKIKLDKGMELMGMGSNKHWALLAHADGGIESFFRNTAGFELGRQIGLEFTPHQQPLELVINGEYQGLYFLTETVRVGNRRVDIAEQKDGETDPELVSGAWLVEIDNADEPEHQVIPPLDGTELTRFCVTWHSPETLSTPQYNYLYNEWVSILQAVYTPDKTSRLWEEHFDMEMLAKYYVVNEMIDHVEAFLGSCFMHKDQGEKRWKMGPMWDLGHAFNDWHNKDSFIWQYKHETESDWEICILEEMVKFPRMQEFIDDVWMNHADQLYSSIIPYLCVFADKIGAASVNDHQRWPKYGTGNIQASLLSCLTKLEQKRAFLVREWGDPSVVDAVTSAAVNEAFGHAIYNMQGQKVTSAKAPGLYIIDGRKYMVK